jgi:ubiquinone biosynthesis protein
MNPIRLLEPVLGPIVLEELSPRLGSVQARAILDDAFADYDRQRPALPHEASAGGRLMVHFAALTIGLYRALLHREVVPAEARSWTASVTARGYAKITALPTALARICTRTARARVKRATDLMRRFPFTPPSYVMVDVPAGDEVVAFDVRRCPVAEYFLAQGLGELCVESWCELDFALARSWGARLQRTCTLAGGGDRCDFRWQAHASTPSRR